MQNDLLLDGKKYISVNRASKETGYSQDYIGQLCRQNKIPSRLIGRTWYLDIDVLTKYKNQVKSKNEKKLVHTDNSVDNIDDLVYTRQENKGNLHEYSRYESEEAVVLPTLKNKKSKKNHSLDLVRNPIVFSSAFLVSLFIAGNVIFSWLSFLAPQQIETVNFEISVISKEIVDGFISIKKDIQLALVASTTNDDAEMNVSEGIVVFPDSPEREDLISRIKNSFSDEVEILMDEGGESGVIRPVFKSGEDDDNYAFVLVPVESKI